MKSRRKRFLVPLSSSAHGDSPVGGSPTLFRRSRRFFFLLVLTICFFLTIVILVPPAHRAVGLHRLDLFGGFLTTRPTKISLPASIDPDDVAKELIAASPFAPHSIHAVVMLPTDNSGEAEPPWQLLELLVLRLEAVRSVTLVIGSGSPTSHALAHSIAQEALSRRRYNATQFLAVVLPAASSLGVPQWPFAYGATHQPPAPPNPEDPLGVQFYLFVSGGMYPVGNVHKWMTALHDSITDSTQETEQIGVASCTLVRSDTGAVVSAGYSLGADTSEGLYAVQHLAGYSMLDKRIASHERIVAASSACLLMRRVAFDVAATKTVRHRRNATSGPNMTAEFISAGKSYARVVGSCSKVVETLDPVIRMLPYRVDDARLFDTLRSRVASALSELSAYELWMAGNSHNQIHKALPYISQQNNACQDEEVARLFHDVVFAAPNDAVDLRTHRHLITIVSMGNDISLERDKLLHEGGPLGRIRANPFRRQLQQLHHHSKNGRRRKGDPDFHAIFKKVQEAAAGGDGSANVITHRVEGNSGAPRNLAEEEEREKTRQWIAKRFEKVHAREEKALALLADAVMYSLTLLSAARKAVVDAHRKVLSICGHVDDETILLSLAARFGSHTPYLTVTSSAAVHSLDLLIDNVTAPKYLGDQQQINKEWLLQLRLMFQKRFVPSSSFFVTWAGYCCHCCGFSNEIAHIVAPLTRYVNVRTTMPSSCHCRGMPNYLADTIDRATVFRGSDKDVVHSNRTTHRKKRSIRDPINVWVHHTDPQVATTLVWKEVTVDYTISRSMFEFTRIPKVWLQFFRGENRTYDEIWVPSQYVADAFEGSGVPRELMRVVPEPVDVYFYDPSTVKPFFLPVALSHPEWRSYSTVGQRVEDAAPVRRNFKFLSIFKWEPRKGWDVLLRGYFAAFTNADAVSLYILTYRWMPAAVEGVGVRDPRSTEFFAAKIRHTALNLTVLGGVRLGPEAADDPHKHILRRLPHIEVITQELSEKEIVALYRSCDAFVLPSRGEGWGLPVIQAMSMGMPTVTTNYSGMLEFTNADIVYPVSVERLERITSAGIELVPNASWAVPSVTHLAEQMQRVFRNREEALHRGRLAREHVMRHFSEDAVAQVIAKRLAQIEMIVMQRRLTALQQTPTVVEEVEETENE